MMNVIIKPVIGKDGLEESQFKTLCRLFDWSMAKEGDDYTAFDRFGNPVLKVKDENAFEFDLQELIMLKYSEGYKFGGRVVQSFYEFAIENAKKNKTQHWKKFLKLVKEGKDRIFDIQLEKESD